MPCKLQDATTQLEILMNRLQTKIDENKIKRVSVTEKDIVFPIQDVVKILKEVTNGSMFEVQTSGRNLLECERLKYQHLQAKTEGYEKLLNSCVDHFTQVNNEEGKKYLIDNGTEIQQEFCDAIKKVEI